MKIGKEKIDDRDVIFSDGVLTILCREKQCDVKTICGEYDEPISLVDIKNQYPNVYMLIFEMERYGEVYRYNNHNDNEWEQVGTTCGYT